MGKFASRALVLGVLCVGCQPMYGPGEHLKSPPKVPHKNVVEPVPTIVYVEDCPTNFHGDPAGVAVDTSRAGQLSASGDDSLRQAEKLADPTTQARAVSVGIDLYRNALVKDPYNAEATLKLALAYDKVYRKGCALKLLARIATLETHPKFKAAARRVVDQVGDTPEWFKGYRQAAIAAVGATPSSSPPQRP